MKRCKDCKWWKKTDLRPDILNPSGKCNGRWNGKYDGYGTHAESEACDDFNKPNKWWKPKTLLLILLLAILLTLCLLAAGCGQVVLKDANGTETFKANWFLYDFNVGKLAYDRLTIEDADGRAKNIKVTTPYGVVESED